MTPLLAAAPAAVLLLATGPQSPSTCTGSLGKSEIVECALARSLEVKRAHQELDALTGRRTTAGTWLPSLPVLSATAAARKQMGVPITQPGGAPLFLNWTATLSQEVDLSGKPGLRVAVVDAESQAQLRRVAVAEQEVSAATLSIYFTVLATQEALALAREVSRVAASLSGLAEARAKEELVSRVDATVGKAEASRLMLMALDAERRNTQARAQLAVLLGLSSSPPLVLEGNLSTIERPVEEDAEKLALSALTIRGEVSAAQVEREVADRHIEILRRERVPNFTFSFFVQRDGFNERVLGGGLSFPLPLIAPVWPSRKGELQEADARLAQSETDVESVRRQVRLEVARALSEDRARALALRLFDAKSLTEARQSLRALGEALSSGQLSLREALIAQRSLIEFLQADVEARLARALARIELLRAAGLPLSGDSL